VTLLVCLVVLALAPVNAQLSGFAGIVGASALIARRRWMLEPAETPAHGVQSTTASDGFADFRALVQHLAWAASPEGTVRFLRPQLVEIADALLPTTAADAATRYRVLGESARLLDPSVGPADLPQDPDRLRELVVSLLDQLENL
jgi:uncharacterized membrane protein YtjA (UPF0391 family)